MATISMASYPHIETNVIDESIYQYANTRILPLQRDLFTVRAQKGRVGVLAWYDQYVEAERALGAETFNELNEKYCSNDALFVKNVMTNNGCFIVRLAEKDGIQPSSKVTHNGISERTGSIKALQILEAVVKCDDEGNLGSKVVVYERDTTGDYLRDEDGNLIPRKLDASGEHVKPFATGSDSKSPDNQIWLEIPNSTLYSPAIPSSGSGENFTPGSPAVAGVDTRNGIEISWRWRYAYIPEEGPGHSSEREEISNMQKYETGTTGNKAIVYPMIVFEAASPGSWGNNNCLEFFYDSSINDRDEAHLIGNVKYTLKPQYKVYGKSSVQSYFDMRGNNSVSFGMEPGKIDDRYMEAIGFNDVLDNSYDEANPLPWDVTYFNENWEEVCNAARMVEKEYYTETYDSDSSKVIDYPSTRVLLTGGTNGNINDYVGKRYTILDSATATVGVRRKVTTNDVGKYVVGSYSMLNAPGDGIADSDTDGLWGTDTFKDEKGNVLAYYELSSDQKKVFNEQAAFYNATEDLSSPWLINIVSGQNLDGKPYHAIVVDNEAYTDPVGDYDGKTATTGTVFIGTNEDDGTELRGYTAWKSADLIKDVLHYAFNGKDGSLKDWDHEQNIRNFYNLTYQYEDTWNPKNIVDRGRFPFNTIFDTGYSLETKNVLCDFLTTREDVKIVLSTQVCNKYLKNPELPETHAQNATMLPKLNTMANDESIGTALQSRVQLMRESIVKGTACCRATIFAHAGYLYGNYKGIVPMTLWSAIRGSEHYNTTTMRGTCKGWPNSQCNIFKELNWVAPDEASHERHWNIGINYVQYYDMDNLHFPSIRTVYKYDTSVLLDDEFTDAIVFVKQAARDSWATYVGMDLPQSEYEALITKDLTARLTEIFNGRYTFSVEAYQTAEEAKRGYVQHVAITIWAPAVKRVWLVDVICRRENFDAAAEAANA